MYKVRFCLDDLEMFAIQFDQNACLVVKSSVCAYLCVPQHAILENVLKLAVADMVFLLVIHPHAI